ncbi:MAG: hypothetical protein M3R24_27670 [Chloroflexota bacterium]|nr:hypothetical protein [Chloroflexota bacterium]
MAYTQQEDLATRGQDRQFSIFTTANIAGGGVLGLAAWQLTRLLGMTGDFMSAGWWFQTALIIAGGVAGVILTIRWSGLSLLDRLMLFGSYQQRRLARHIMIQPETALANTGRQTMTTLYRDGQVLLRPYSPEDSV